MARIRFCVLALAVCWLLCLPVTAAEVDSDSVYCFSAEDFSQEEALTGICITSLPEELGLLQLNQRILRQGDILTAEQVAQMAFSPLSTETDRTLEVGYLPIYDNFVGEEAVMTLAIRGRENKVPVAEDSSLETYKNLPNTGKLKVTDPEGEVMTYTLIRQPRRGTVELGDDGSFTYTPKKNKVGVDSFTYTATDAAGKVSREATVTVTILKPTDAAQYTDTVGHDCRFAAEWMKHTGIFLGESLGQDSCFGPEKEVTRGEFVTMLVNALEISAQEEVSYTGYSDEIPQWLRPYVAAALRAGLTDGLPDQQTFGAEESITGAEAAVMLENALDTLAFSDLTEEKLTRGDAAKVLYEAAKILEAKREENLV